MSSSWGISVLMQGNCIEFKLEVGDFLPIRPGRTRIILSGQSSSQQTPTASASGTPIAGQQQIAGRELILHQHSATEIADAASKAGWVDCCAPGIDCYFWYKMKAASEASYEVCNQPWPPELLQDQVQMSLLFNACFHSNCIIDLASMLLMPFNAGKGIFGNLLNY